MFGTDAIDKDTIYNGTYPYTYITMTGKLPYLISIMAIAQRERASNTAVTWLLGILRVNQFA